MFLDPQRIWDHLHGFIYIFPYLLTDDSYEQYAGEGSDLRTRDRIPFTIFLGATDRGVGNGQTIFVSKTKAVIVDCKYFRGMTDEQDDDTTVRG